MSENHINQANDSDCKFGALLDVEQARIEPDIFESFVVDAESKSGRKIEVRKDIRKIVAQFLYVNWAEEIGRFGAFVAAPNIPATCSFPGRVALSIDRNQSDGFHRKSEHIVRKRPNRFFVGYIDRSTWR